MSQKTHAEFEVPPVRQVEPAAALRWFREGWHDMRRTGWPSLAHGILVAVISIVIVAVALLYWPLLPAAMSGFLIVGPFLATGLYALSRRLERGDRPLISHAIAAWKSATGCLFRYCCLLVLAGTVWVAFSVAMFHFFIDAPIRQPLDFLRYVVVQHDYLFLLWAILGGLGSALAFATTVITMPMLVDRDVDTKLAILTSVKAVGENPGAMLVWAGLILVATGFSVITGMLGFLVLYPVMGHASWRVYRDLVDPAGLPERPCYA